MKDPKFYNKNGELNLYGLACGYIEQSENDTRWKKLYMEHSHFHVMMGGIDSNGKHTVYTVWETYDRDELTKARKLYRSL